MPAAWTRHIRHPPSTSTSFGAVHRDGVLVVGKGTPVAERLRPIRPVFDCPIVEPLVHSTTTTTTNERKKKKTNAHPVEVLGFALADGSRTGLAKSALEQRGHRHLSSDRKSSNAAARALMPHHRRVPPFQPFDVVEYADDGTSAFPHRDDAAAAAAAEEGVSFFHRRQRSPSRHASRRMGNADGSSMTPVVSTPSGIRQPSPLAEFPSSSAARRPHADGNIVDDGVQPSTWMAGRGWTVVDDRRLALLASHARVSRLNAMEARVENKTHHRNNDDDGEHRNHNSRPMSSPKLTSAQEDDDARVPVQQQQGGGGQANSLLLNATTTSSTGERGGVPFGESLPASGRCSPILAASIARPLSTTPDEEVVDTADPFRSAVESHRQSRSSGETSRSPPPSSFPAVVYRQQLEEEEADRRRRQAFSSSGTLPRTQTPLAPRRVSVTTIVSSAAADLHDDDEAPHSGRSTPASDGGDTWARQGVRRQGTMTPAMVQEHSKMAARQSRILNGDDDTMMADQQRRGATPPLRRSTAAVQTSPRSRTPPTGGDAVDEVLWMARTPSPCPQRGASPAAPPGHIVNHRPPALTTPTTFAAATYNRNRGCDFATPLSFAAPTPTPTRPTTPSSHQAAIDFVEETVLRPVAEAVSRPPTPPAVVKAMPPRQLSASRQESTRCDEDEGGGGRGGAGPAATMEEEEGEEERSDGAASPLLPSTTAPYLRQLGASTTPAAHRKEAAVASSTPTPPSLSPAFQEGRQASEQYHNREEEARKGSARLVPVIQHQLATVSSNSTQLRGGEESSRSYASPLRQRGPSPHVLHHHTSSTSLDVKDVRDFLALRERYIATRELHRAQRGVMTANTAVALAQRVTDAQAC